MWEGKDQYMQSGSWGLGWKSRELEVKVEPETSQGRHVGGHHSVKGRARTCIRSAAGGWLAVGALLRPHFRAVACSVWVLCLLPVPSGCL